VGSGRSAHRGVAMPLVYRHAIELVDAPTPGRLRAVLPVLKRRLTLLGRDAEVMRVGVTTDVVRRAREHSGYGLDWFVVLWETSSARLADEAEGALIDHATGQGLPLTGDRRGGVRGAGPFAVYVAGR
jgi:hypothetical protein